MNRTFKWLVAGGLVAGVLDISYAIIFSWLRSGTAPTRLLQSVASGLLGREAYKGGIATAALGLALHFTIALSAAAAYFLASRWVPILVRRPLASGIAFGALFYAFMNAAVIPLSRIGPRPFPPASVFVSGLLVHMFFIGVPIAFAARRARLFEAGA